MCLLVIFKVAKYLCCVLLLSSWRPKDFHNRDCFRLFWYNSSGVYFVLATDWRIFFKTAVFLQLRPLIMYKQVLNWNGWTVSRKITLKNTINCAAPAQRRLHLPALNLRFNLWLSSSRLWDCACFTLALSPRWRRCINTSPANSLTRYRFCIDSDAAMRLFFFSFFFLLSFVLNVPAWSSISCSRPRRPCANPLGAPAVPQHLGSSSRGRLASENVPERLWLELSRCVFSFAKWRPSFFLFPCFSLVEYLSLGK